MARTIEERSGMKTRRVRVWTIQARTGAGKKRSYLVRWSVAGREKSKAFATRALADNHRSDLMQAMNRGEQFDTETGLPESMTETQEGPTWLEFVESYVAMKWPGAAAKSRTSMVDALITVTPMLVRDMPGRPSLDLLRVALRDFVLPPARRLLQQPDDIALAVRWLRRASVPLAGLVEAPIVRLGMDALAFRLDGKPVAATTLRRKRSVFYNVLQYAVELETLPFNPADKLRVRSRRSKVVAAVDRRVVVSPAQARALLNAVESVGTRGRGKGLKAFFACLYYAALRPGEALGLRERDC
jgi:hypothetical protein